MTKKKEGRRICRKEKVEETNIVKRRGLITARQRHSRKKINHKKENIKREGV